MDYQFTLRRFFVLVFLFVICTIVGWIAYAHRTNAPANMYENNEGTYSSNNVTIPDDKLDMATPFYQNKAAKALEKEAGRPTESNMEDKYYDGEKKAEGNEPSSAPSKKENK